MMTHHLVVTLSLRIKKIILTNFVIFRVVSITLKNDIFSDIIYPMINQCVSTRSKGASCGHEVFASRLAQVRIYQLSAHIYTFYDSQRLSNHMNLEPSRVFGFCKRPIEVQGVIKFGVSVGKKSVLEKLSILNDRFYC